MSNSNPFEDFIQKLDLSAIEKEKPEQIAQIETLISEINLELSWNESGTVNFLSISPNHQEIIDEIQQFYNDPNRHPIEAYFFVISHEFKKTMTLSYDTILDIHDDRTHLEIYRGTKKDIKLNKLTLDNLIDVLKFLQ